MHRSLTPRRRWLTSLALLASGLAASTLVAEPTADAPSAATSAPAADGAPAADASGGGSTLAEVQDRLATALKSYLLLQDENAQLKADLDKQAAERGALAEQLAAARAAMASLRVAAAASAQIGPLQNELRQAQAETAALAAENADLRTRLALQGPAPGRWSSPERPAAPAPAPSGGGFASDHALPASPVAASSNPASTDGTDDAPALPAPTPAPASSPAAKPKMRAAVTPRTTKPSPEAAAPASVPTAASNLAPAPPVIAPVAPVAAVTPVATLAPVAAVAPGAGVALVPTATPATAPRVHLVVENETLTLISKHYYGTTRRWKDILAANPTVIKGEKGLIVGSSIVIPP